MAPSIVTVPNAEMSSNSMPNSCPPSRFTFTEPRKVNVSSSNAARLPAKAAGSTTVRFSASLLPS